MPTPKQVWMTHEAQVRCPVVPGRGRLGITAARKDLIREWNAMDAATRVICQDELQNGIRSDISRVQNQINGIAAQAAAVAIRNAPNSNEQSADYFDACRTAAGHHLAWETACTDAANAWLNLANAYRLVPAANRSLGQNASINEANTRFNAAVVAAAAATAGLNTIDNWINTDPVYANQGVRPVVHLQHMPVERIPGRDRSALRDFAANGVAPPGMWRSVAGRAFIGDTNETRVWFQVNAAGNIINRMVLKEQDTPNMRSFYHYKGALSWELECGRLLTIADRTDGNISSIVRLRRTTIAPLRSWVDRVARLYKVYMDWCPHGDLDELIVRYAALPAPGNKIPEPFVWSVAESLIRSGQRMINLQNTNGGDQMVHRDIKPANVFLDANMPTNYPDYPTVRLGDFGQGFTTSVNDDRNPYWWTIGSGTLGFGAPEMQRYVDQNPPHARIDEFPMLEYTNVWQMGAVLRSLVTLQDDPPQSLFLDGAADTTYRVSNGSNANANRYSLNLLVMIDDMMRYDTAARPTFNQLAARIAVLGNVSLGMRGGTATPAVRNASLLHPVTVQADIYQIGFLPPP